MTNNPKHQSIIDAFKNSLTKNVKASVKEMPSYLENLITEKGVDTYKDINLEGFEGHIGFTYEVLIQNICALRAEDQITIRATLSAIDYLNGDVFHFLHFLAKGFMQQVSF